MNINKNVDGTDLTINKKALENYRRKKDLVEKLANRSLRSNLLTHENILQVLKDHTRKPKF